MKNLLIILIATLMSLSACKTVKEYVPVERIVHETVTVRDTVVTIQLEQVRDSVIIPLALDTASFLENSYAYSYALVAEGNLTHSLGTQKTPVAVKTEYIETYRIDSIPYIQEVPVPGKDVIIHSPTFWQKVQYIILGIIIALAGLIVCRLFKLKI
ncbi:MAG: hypothetical protein LBJ39_03385 [Tannerellaceae bacterium]|nr:hypothetical protein [Tannerellaceae bacterium]